MQLHGNSNQNTKEHHLYTIRDREEEDIFKFGISDKSIEEDEYSIRMREQVNYLNRAVGWFRYFAQILVRGIKGKAKVIEIEEKYIDDYRIKYGRNPRGNVKKTKKQRNNNLNV